MRSLRALNIQKVDQLGKLVATPVGTLLGLAGDVDKLYRRGETTKKSGGVRVLYKPVWRLKALQGRINRLLQRVDLPPYMHGCRPRHSIVDNARPHVAKPMVLNMDVKDFFPSIRAEHVYRTFVGLGCSPDVSRQEHSSAKLKS